MSKTIIKKHRNRNEYLLAEGGLWVRNFTRAADAVDINNLTRQDDYQLVITNEMHNRTLGLASISAESFVYRDAVIVSDGYKFEEKQHILEKLPKRVKVIGVNQSLLKWKTKRIMDFYVVNNPYKECLTYLPRHDYFPPCIASSRTNNDFLRRYKTRHNTVYRYEPVKEEKFSPPSLQDWSVDDYRNPICAAMVLLYRFKVERLLLMCCDESFADERPGAERVADGLWMYPQHRTTKRLIEGNIYWLSQLDIPVKVGNYSEGLELDGADKLLEEQVLRFFD